MLTNQPKPVRRAASGLVLALFPDSMSVRYAILDLYQAGFGAGQIRIAVSCEGKPPREPLHHPTRSRLKPVWSGMPKDGFERDPNESKPLYSEVDLEEMLLGLGFLLPDREMERRGTLVLIDAGGRSKEVQSILEWNRGWVRTDMAAEQIPPAA